MFVRLVPIEIVNLSFFPYTFFVEREPDHWENPVKAKLRESRPVFGAHITVPCVETAAMLADTGFDFLWIEMEHSAITLETARNIILATRGLKAVPFIRVPQNELWLAKRALDIGALGIIFPFTSTAQLARQAVAACRYGPEGRRGVGPALASFRWPAPDEGYPRFADRNVAVILMIETGEAVRNIDEIASVPGIDALYIGVNDLSYSLGYGGQFEHPVVREAIDTIVAAARRSRLPVGRPGPTAEAVRGFLAAGFRIFQSPRDTSMLRTAGQAYLQQSISDPGQGRSE
ncbi:MAG: aldolase/citrate lyase family protein [Acidobacteriota bacterium]